MSCKIQRWQIWQVQAILCTNLPVQSPVPYEGGVLRSVFQGMACCWAVCCGCFDLRPEVFSSWIDWFILVHHVHRPPWHQFGIEAYSSGFGKCPIWGILNVTFKYLLEIISPIFGWCSIRTFTYIYQALIKYSKHKKIQTLRYDICLICVCPIWWFWHVPTCSDLCALHLWRGCTCYSHPSNFEHLLNNLNYGGVSIYQEPWKILAKPWLLGVWKY